ncbi:hypothetical protein pb186bvf_002445 [Paramecium bursaria]
MSQTSNNFYYFFFAYYKSGQYIKCPIPLPNAIVKHTHQQKHYDSRL